MLTLPEYVSHALITLQSAGHCAYVVGGCVRDSLLGRLVSDWDITTSARPEETMLTFAEETVIPTGIEHGTITVLIDGHPLEITTFRTESGYTDRRRPDSVTFVSSLEEDLRRRDFTINAMAYSSESGLLDYFGGQQDLAAKTIRCVGNPTERFSEDALRILRALRFAAALGFSIESETAAAAKTQQELLLQIAPERCSKELTGMLCGKAATEVLLAYPRVLSVILPELLPMVGFDQQNRHHCYDVWEHTARSVGAIAPEPVLRWTMLLHDIGKPPCFSLGPDGQGNFYGHARQSVVLAEAILRRLRIDNQTIEAVVKLIRYHDSLIEPEPRHIKRWLNRLGPEAFFCLLQIKAADNAAQAPEYHGRQQEIEELRKLAEDILLKEECFSLRQLAVNGSDLLTIGVPEGKECGEILNALLEAVVDGACPNKKEVLLQYAKSLLKI